MLNVSSLDVVEEKFFEKYVTIDKIEERDDQSKTHQADLNNTDE